MRSPAGPCRYVSAPRAARGADGTASSRTNNATAASARRRGGPRLFSFLLFFRFLHVCSCLLIAFARDAKSALPYDTVTLNSYRAPAGVTEAR